MVDLTKLEIENDTQLIAARVPRRYIRELEKRGIKISDFVRQAFKETFDK